MSMIGADAGALDQAAGRLRAAADEIDGHLGAAASLIGGLQWFGNVASSFIGAFTGVHLPTARSTSDLLRRHADLLCAHASEQRGASADVTGATGSSRLRSVARPSVEPQIRRLGELLDTGGWGVTKSDLRAIVKIFETASAAERDAILASLTDQQLGVLKDQLSESLLKGGLSEAERVAFMRLMDPVSFDQLNRLLGDDAPQIRDVRALVPSGNVTDAFRSAMLATHNGPAGDEIEVRRLDSGKYIVVMPGVVDLTDSVSKGPLSGPLYAMGTNPHDSARDIHYIAPAAAGDLRGSTSGSNGYAYAVKLAMQRAGVPAGAEVTLVGHSGGAYTAYQMAADPGFNRAAPDASGGFSVRVTNVVGAGGDVAWMGAGLPSHTDGLVLRSRNDVPARIESLLSPNSLPSNSVTVIDFDGAWGAPVSFGHRPDLTYVEPFDYPPSALQRYMNSVDSGYKAGGTSYMVSVKDAYR